MTLNIEGPMCRQGGETLPKSRQSWGRRKVASKEIKR